MSSNLNLGVFASDKIPLIQMIACRGQMAMAVTVGTKPKQKCTILLFLPCCA